MQIGQESICARKEKEMAAEEEKLAKQFEKMYKPTQRPEEDIHKAIESEREARERGDV
jgi:hypothetical protein